MSTQSDKPDETEREINKKVDIVCYLEGTEDESKRGFANRIDDSRDYTKRKTRTSEKEKFFIQGPELPGWEQIKVPIEEEEFLALDEIDTGSLESIKEVEVNKSTDFIHSPRLCARDISNSILKSVLKGYGELPFGWEVKRWNKKIRGSEGNTKFRTRVSYERMEMLKHMSEITPDDMFVEGSESQLAIKVKCVVNGVTEGQLKWIDKNVISSLIKYFSAHGLIERVRVYDCETRTKESGVCFNI